MCCKTSHQFPFENEWCTFDKIKKHLETKLFERFERFKHEKILLIASNIKYWNFAIIIATLTSGLRPRQGVVRLRAKREA